MTTIDPKTGVTHLSPDDPRDQADRENAEAYREEQLQEYGDVHAPYAYPALDPETGHLDWCGG